MSDINPNDVYRETGRWFAPVVLAGLAALAVLLIIGFVGWQASWWFTSQNANREAHMIRSGYANQQTLRDEITKDIAGVETITVQVAAAGRDASLVTALKAQRASTAGTVCQDASEATGDPLPAQQAHWVTVNCTAGTLSPSSSYYVASLP